jgi:hypothetical protein
MSFWVRETDLPLRHFLAETTLIISGAYAMRSHIGATGHGTAFFTSAGIFRFHYRQRR